MAQINGIAPASLLMLALFSFMPLASAHTARATMDPRGISATFTALARVTCFDDGNGLPDALQVRLRDNSPATPGLLVSVQLLKGKQAVSITDITSGDADYTLPLQLQGGAGVYTMMINKTAAGPRDIDIEWHCVTAEHDHEKGHDSGHTGTEILVDQFK
jgi:hypothetical protein